MPVRLAAISKPEQDELLTFLRKHPIYPYRQVFNVAINATNFPGNLTSIYYRSIKWTPDQTVGVVSLAAGFIVTPNTTVDTFGMVVSYRPTFTITDGGLTLSTNEGDDIYQLVSNGGAINDFQVFYPLNWLVEKGQAIYVHLFAGSTAITAGTSTMLGHVVFGTLKGGI